MNISKRRLGVIAAAVGALGAITALGLGGTSALYTSTADGQSNSIESGTVTLTKNLAKSFEFHETGFMPGDSVGPSKYWVDYSGEDAFVGLDLTISSTADQPCAAYVGGQNGITPADLMSHCTGTGTVPMFNGDHTAGSLDLSVLPQNGLTAHQLFNAADLEPGTVCNADTAGVVTCSIEKQNVVLPPHSMTSPAAADSLKWIDGTGDWITVTASLPLAATNIFQGSTVDIEMTAHAVQYANNGGTAAQSVLAGTTLPNGIHGAGNQSDVLFPLGW